LQTKIANKLAQLTVQIHTAFTLGAYNHDWVKGVISLSERGTKSMATPTDNLIFQIELFRGLER
jgi:hypothetical protein